ncbi:MAG: hypothetical protein H8E24_09065 [Verrucomicrobia bacterium]|nr:hypothetical protein [Verrucomicrobiota bacterium]
MITTLFTLSVGFALGLFYSKGKHTPFRDFKRDLGQTCRRMRHLFFSLFKDEPQPEGQRESIRAPKL